MDGPQHQREVQLVVSDDGVVLLGAGGKDSSVACWRVKVNGEASCGFPSEHPQSYEGGLLSLFRMPLWKMFALDTMMGEVPCVLNERKCSFGR